MPYTAEELSHILNRGMNILKSNHLLPMRKEGLINYLYPEIINHPYKAYVITEKGQKLLVRK